eukprot:Skav236757  [mRNA]  locus=scaffold2899:236716:238604:- [translate_table: standard]
MKLEARVFAALLVCAVAELRVSRRAEQQSTLVAPVPGSVARCQLQGPLRGAAAQLRSARPDHVTTLETLGELRVTGRLDVAMAWWPMP